MYARNACISFQIKSASVAFLCLVSVSLAARTESCIESVLEHISFQMTDDQEIDMTTLYEDLLYFSQHPINLNKASKSDLDKLLFLSDIQIENILFYRFQYGEIFTLHELSLIDGLDDTVISFLKNFTTISFEKGSESLNFKEIFKVAHHEILWRLDGGFNKKSGFRRDRVELNENPHKSYLGDPFYTSLKYRFRSKERLQFGLSMEKDAGEPFLGKYNKGYDFYGAYFQLKNIWKFATINLGDYRAVFGQGLVMRSEFKMPHASVIHVTPRNNGFRKNSSTDEFSFLRGVATTMEFGKFKFSAFYSFRKMDADTIGGSFATLKADGLHRKLSELDKKRTLPTQIIGGNLSFEHRHFHLGITSSTMLSALPRIPSDAFYTTYFSKGKVHSAVGIDYKFRLHRFNFFGETAICSNLGVATVNGVFFTPTAMIGLVFLHRYYSPKYDVLYANAFGSSNSINEHGFYMGMELQPVKYWRFSFSGDAFYRPWSSFLSVKPSVHYTVLLRADYAPKRTVSMYFQLLYKLQEKTLPSTNVTAFSGFEKKIKLTCRLSYQISGVELHSALSLSRAKTTLQKATFGAVISQTVSYLIPVINVRLNARYCYFDAENYENHFSIYEDDVPFTFSIPMLYGKGSRYYFNVGYNVLKNFSLWFKFAQTYYSDGREFVGSGWDKIIGNRKSDFRVQMRFKF